MWVMSLFPFMCTLKVYVYFYSLFDFILMWLLVISKIVFVLRVGLQISLRTRNARNHRLNSRTPYFPNEKYSITVSDNFKSDYCPL